MEIRWNLRSARRDRQLRLMSIRWWRHADECWPDLPNASHQDPTRRWPASDRHNANWNRSTQQRSSAIRLTTTTNESPIRVDRASTSLHRTRCITFTQELTHYQTCTGPVMGNVVNLLCDCYLVIQCSLPVRCIQYQVANMLPPLPGKCFNS